MNDKSAYKPRLGIDIRVKPPSEGKGRPKRKRPVETENEPCAWPGCKSNGVHRAPVGDGDDKYQLLCLEHVREFNQSWNFFKDMDDEDIQEKIKNERSTGGRPTWQFSNEAVRDPDPAKRFRSKSGQRSAAYHRAYMRINGMKDPYSLFRADENGVEGVAPQRRLNKIQRNAIETLDLPETAKMDQIKTRYKELLKRLHPDTNGGDTSTVERLRLVIKAYNVLKSSNIS